VSVPDRLAGTIFSRFGYWPLGAAMVLGLAIAVASSRRRRA
jgi:hypothetical protein